MTAELSPGLLLAPTRRAEAYRHKRRHDVSVPAPVTGRLDAVLDRVASSHALWLAPVLLFQAVLCLRINPGIATIPVMAATVLIYLTSRRFFGQGGGLFAAWIFALTPSTTFAARFSSADAVCLLALAAALYVATKDPRRIHTFALAGGFLALATTERYVAGIFVPGVVAIACVVTRQRLATMRTIVSAALLLSTTLGSLAVVAALGHWSWQAFTRAAWASSGVTASTLPHDGWTAVAVLSTVSLAAIVALRPRRTFVAVVVASALAPIAVQVSSQGGVPRQTTIALSVVVLAPVLGGFTAWLVRRGRYLALRAPLALIGGVALLSTGMAASTQLVQSATAAGATPPGPVVHAVPPATSASSSESQRPAPRPGHAVSKAAALHPQRKYFGVFAARAPASLAPIHRIAAETGKQPNLDLYYQAWGTAAATGTTNFSTSSAERACSAGLLPMMTWESWNPAAHDRRGTTNNWTQRRFAPSRIAAGHDDRYIRATARAIASLNCPIAVRFDQEVNGFWYPWGLGTAGMPGSAAHRATAYVAMWRHVWRIFQRAGATNVIWVWSPNIQPVDFPGYPPLAASYPGRKYVDWVGVDGYYSPYPGLPNPRFEQVFSSTFDLLRGIAPHKPWLIAETAVSAGPNQPAQIADLLHHVATDKRLSGFVYFDSDKAHDRADWRFDSTHGASLQAFRHGISRRIYATGKAGSLSGR